MVSPNRCGREHWKSRPQIVTVSGAAETLVEVFMLMILVCCLRVCRLIRIGFVSGVFNDGTWFWRRGMIDDVDDCTNWAANKAEKDVEHKYDR